MNKWPDKPLAHIVGWLKTLLAEDQTGLHGNDVARPLFVDMGSGDCELWRSLKEKNCSVVSVDFAPPPDIDLPEVRTSAEEYLQKGGLIKSSIKSVPILPSQCASVVVFCLSLMGVDWPSFMKEGYRLVRDK